MKRLVLSLAAAASVLGPLASTPALAEGRWSREERYERREERWERHRESRGEGWERRRDGRSEGWDRREWNRNGRGGYEERRWRDGPPPSVTYRREGPLRRGGRLPPGYGGQVIEDYPRYRLRPPPRGYTWRHVEEGYMLTGPNGVIFDIIPE
jgi:Ni/Co efflux regulator RcnB